MKTIAYCFDNTKPTILIVDEADVDVTEPFVMPVAPLGREHTPPIQVILRMPDLPPAFFQLPSFQKWYSARAEELREYADAENMRHAHKDIHFVVARGAAHKVRREALKAESAKSAYCHLPEKPATPRVSFKRRRNIARVRH